MDIFENKEYTIRRKLLCFLGQTFYILDPVGQMILYCHQKAFRLKEDIRIYTDENKTQERLMIKARQIIDFSAAYDVVDSVEGKKIGALRRKGWASILKDSWELLDLQDNPIGTVEEDSWLMATLRRFVTNLIPQTFYARKGDQVLATFRQNFNFFTPKLFVTLHPESEGVVDPRLALAAGILLAAIEGRQH
jgi:uncharacterized protein YxjI